MRALYGGEATNENNITDHTRGVREYKTPLSRLARWADLRLTVAGMKKIETAVEVKVEMKVRS